MPPMISALLACMTAPFRSRASLHMEHLALRHQLAVYQRSVPRPHLRAMDHLFWVWLPRPWPGWRDALACVQPRTVIAWQQQRFRNHWRRLGQQGTPWSPRRGQGGTRAHPGDAAGKSHLGLASDRRRAAQAGHRGGQVDGGNVSRPTAETVVSNVEDLFEEPRAGPRGPGFLCRADGYP
jgi:hypothetical protein